MARFLEACGEILRSLGPYSQRLEAGGDSWNVKECSVSVAGQSRLAISLTLT